MKVADLDILLQEGEGVMLEYKEGISGSFARELVAFANTAGGKILLGVRDNGTVKGIADTNVLRARIQDIARNCDPPVQILLQHIGMVTVVTVLESDAKPVQCSDGFFLRQGAVTQKLSREEIRDMFRQGGAVRFDLSPCPAFRYPEDFDPVKFREWLQKSTISQPSPVEDILVNIEAAERSGGKLLFRNAGVLFFAREPRRFFNHAYVTCLLFKGTVKLHVLDRKDFAGGIVADIEESLRFIERNTRTAYRIEKLQREEIPQYPVAALREALTNAVMHRDWFIEGGNVFVEIYDDRIEVSSPGTLPKGMLPEDLGSKSIRRNPLIADLLHRIAFIEKAGTGIRRMRDGAREMGYPEPEFIAGNFFTALFRPIHEASEQGIRHVPDMHPTCTAHVPDMYPACTPQVIAILNLAEGEAKTRGVLQEVAKIKNREHFYQHYLQPLLSAGLLERTVPDKPRSPKQRYVTTAAGRAMIEKSDKES
ncbi:ATP-binding protein [Chlorobium phaeobacteroides]|uniref:Putative transcriptional regulator n=1 Tax=Chlorobium phaeobacteroides (strain DSM 266 / SMG 266 / 2430) TaxID=290317 RepID=A1BH47_CHLPD|nr:ATP-binding protein [Chlorobium phaeobacteroides]ABL65724.1 putative transcriptional regulator [Chlorobium phaeobacteroides DSM 266]